MTETRGILTLSELGHLADIMLACERGETITFMLEDDGPVITGVARHFVKDPEQAYFIGSGIDVRDAYVRTSGMFETFTPVMDMVKALTEGRASIRH